jgi:xylose isomerase
MLCYYIARDIAPEGATLAESNAMLEKVVELAEHLQKETGKKVLWGTAQLFKHPRYMHGAATSAMTTSPASKPSQTAVPCQRMRTSSIGLNLPLV